MGQRVLKLSGEILMGILNGFKDGLPPRYFQVVQDALPDDVKIVHSSYDIHRNEVELILESESFPPAPWGTVIRPVVHQVFLERGNAETASNN